MHINCTILLFRSSAASSQQLPLANIHNEIKYSLVLFLFRQSATAAAKVQGGFFNTLWKHPVMHLLKHNEQILMFHNSSTKVQMNRGQLLFS